ncbi:Alanyl-tRNA synthetase domain protein [Conexivisphaera calida]|uniref:Alanyl-tRNA synthetase domain protein n=1 Tax=Conexivisphaera calida TaxID=1874277 RepID=A0A4P2VCH9_9ARCH|nr:Alanyl-tRNA synthetase domain protein [Conexivisphaera calida]
MDVAYPDEMSARAHTALHVVKGAAVRVLGEGARWTAGTFVEGGHGRLTLKFERKPTPDEISRIEEEANRCVERDLRIEVLELERGEAESTFGDLMYDLFPVPADVMILRVVLIRDVDGSIWNVNACNKSHVESTGRVGRITLGDARFRPSRSTLEIPFDVSTTP